MKIDFQNIFPWKKKSSGIKKKRPLVSPISSQKIEKMVSVVFKSSHFVSVTFQGGVVGRLDLHNLSLLHPGKLVHVFRAQIDLPQEHLPVTIQAPLQHGLGDLCRVEKMAQLLKGSSHFPQNLQFIKNTWGQSYGIGADLGIKLSDWLGKNSKVHDRVWLRTQLMEMKQELLNRDCFVLFLSKHQLQVVKSGDSFCVVLPNFETIIHLPPQEGAQIKSTVREAMQCVGHSPQFLYSPKLMLMEHKHNIQQNVKNIFKSSDQKRERCYLSLKETLKISMNHIFFSFIKTII